jgi:hypothetical protein
MLPVIAMRASIGSDARRERRALSRKSYTGKNQEARIQNQEREEGEKRERRMAGIKIPEREVVMVLGVR